MLSEPSKRARILFWFAGVVAAAALTFLLIRSHFAHPLDNQGRRFVTLALMLEQFDARAVDAYYGPPELKTGAASSLDTIRNDLIQLRADLDHDTPSPRRDRLRGRTDHLIALIGVMEKPGSLSFDQETRRVYGMALPAEDRVALAQARGELDTLLPGPGTLVSRVAAFNSHFVIPQERRRLVFDRALAECRARTLRHWQLPGDEKLDVVWTDDVDAAWHRYQGGDRSLLQINPQAVATPADSLDVACHEAYPGHHAQFVAMAMDAGPQGLPVEDTIVILRSPEQVLREGAANYGAILAFTPQERLAFLRDVLFPLAGFQPRDAELYVRVHQMVGALAPAAMPVLRDYRDGRLTFYDAMTALDRDALVASPKSLLQFTAAFGAYTLGYTVARDLVRDCVAARGGDPWLMLRAIVAKQDMSALATRCLPAP